MKFLAATKLDKNWYKAWHAWALANYEVVAYQEKHGEEVKMAKLAQHIVPAVYGFFRSIALARGNSLRDTLRLLTLWFKYGHQQDVQVAINEGFSSVIIDTWLQVIPQVR